MKKILSLGRKTDQRKKSVVTDELITCEPIRQIPEAERVAETNRLFPHQRRASRIAHIAPDFVARCMATALANVHKARTIANIQCEGLLGRLYEKCVDRVVSGFAARRASWTRNSSSLGGGDGSIEFEPVLPTVPTSTDANRIRPASDFHGHRKLKAADSQTPTSPTQKVLAPRAPPRRKASTGSRASKLAPMACETTGSHSLPISGILKPSIGTEKSIECKSPDSSGSSPSPSPRGVVFKERSSAEFSGPDGSSAKNRGRNSSELTIPSFQRISTELESMFPHLRTKIQQIEDLNISGLVSSWCQHAVATIHADNSLKNGYFNTVGEFVDLVCVNAFNNNKQPKGRSKRASIQHLPADFAGQQCAAAGVKMNGCTANGQEDGEGFFRELTI